MLKVTECARINSFVEALVNMVCELKLLQGLKKLCKNEMLNRHPIKESLAKNSVMRPMKYI